jgi:hypothetical protein
MGVILVLLLGLLGLIFVWAGKKFIHAIAWRSTKSNLIKMYSPKLLAGRHKAKIIKSAIGGWDPEKMDDMLSISDDGKIRTCFNQGKEGFRFNICFDKTIIGSPQVLGLNKIDYQKKGILIIKEMNESTLHFLLYYDDEMPVEWHLTLS